MGFNDQQRQVLLKEGAFRGLRQLESMRQITPAESKAAKVSFMKTILDEVSEARKELAHLQTALTALGNAAQNGVSQHGGPSEATIDQMTNHLITFDAWVISLVETDLTIAGFLNPGHTRNKITEMSRALNALMDKRAAEKHPVLDDPNLFRGYVDR
jgi:hypothetical protein